MSELLWANLRAPQLRKLADEDAIVLVPVGSTEQHGPHLPVQVDALTSGEICLRAARLVSKEQPVVVTPTVWTGLAEHHMDFGGTFTLDFDTFRALLACICESLTRHGFRRIFLLNGHGGNIAALNTIVQELSQELEAPICTATYPHLDAVAEKYGQILERQRNVQHAGEAETSMMLELAPDLVDQQAAEEAVEVRADWKEGGVFRLRTFSQVTENGYIGAPASADAEKGRQLLDAAAEGLADTLLNGGLW